MKKSIYQSLPCVFRSKSEVYCFYVYNAHTFEPSDSSGRYIVRGFDATL